MAGIIAGRDAGFRADRPTAHTFAGMAPGARILNLKVATGDGGADVSQVIAALDWVVQHRSDGRMDVRVINLAYGTASVQPTAVDPLAHAVENAWRHGIVVVAAAGNDGVGSPSLLMPAADPYVIAVGAVDHMGTRWTDDDQVADFSNGGGPSRRPDLLAPGKSLVSLRVAGSFVDEYHPEGLIASEPQQRFFRGSGTSQATAVVSGAVALLLQKHPELTPDQVKATLRGTADDLRTGYDPAAGAGVLDVDGALSARTVPAYRAAQHWPVSTGLGSLEASRAGEHILDPLTGTELTGETDALGDPWDAGRWATASAGGRAWDDGVWGSRAWTGDGWTTHGWAATVWSGTSWSGTEWADHAWSEAYWEARSWRDDSWLARSWRGGTWEARSWRSDSWLARSWRSDSFLARSWRTLT
jgi:serine protease AprX